MSIFKKLAKKTTELVQAGDLRGVLRYSRDAMDFVAIGDMVIDQFIRLKDAHETVNKGSGATELCMIFGTKLPFEYSEEVVAVGNSANAAVAASRIGLSSGLVAHVGADDNGKKCIEKLKEERVSTKFVGVHKGLKTNYHFVLWYGSERTILIKHEDFPLTLPDLGSPKWLYISSLGEKSLDFHTKIAEYIERHPDVRVVFQPGTYQIKFGADSPALARIYRRTELFFCNLEEARLILKKDKSVANNSASEIKDLLAGLRSLGVRLPVITDGPHGAYTYIYGDTGLSAQKSEYVGHLSIYPDIAPPLERTGAGDAFASTFSSAIALGKSVETALKWGSINSMSVCQKVGAQAGLLTEVEIEKYLAKAPKGWGVERV